MTTDTDTLVALAADAREIASERREKAAESHMMAMAVRNAVPTGNADGWQMAADYALRTARVLDAFSDLVAQLTEARAGEDELLKALREIAEITERKENKFPSDWRDQISACPECQRYKDHPIQNGICDQHRKPIYAQEDHDRHETKILGYRAKDIARAALASHAKRKEGR